MNGYGSFSFSNLYSNPYKMSRVSLGVLLMKSSVPEVPLVYDIVHVNRHIEKNFYIVKKITPNRHSLFEEGMTVTLRRFYIEELSYKNDGFTFDVEPKSLTYLFNLKQIRSRCGIEQISMFQIAEDYVISKY